MGSWDVCVNEGEGKGQVGFLFKFISVSFFIVKCFKVWEALSIIKV